MKASILTSCYNCAPWLKQCIRSVLSQTCVNWEWIIVNDKSTDKSLSILKKAAKKCNKIKDIFMGYFGRHCRLAFVYGRSTERKN